MTRLFSTTLAITALFLSVISASHAAVGRTLGQSSVSPTGAAQYVIPLSLPRGTADLTPEVSLAYQHGDPDNALGAGWRVDGLSSITRCQKTLAQDGAVGVPTLSASDVFCLDGIRLRHTGGSSYAAAGSTYQTEIETYAKAIVTHSDGNGPLAWLLYGKNGLIYEYGNSDDSRIESLGTSVPRLWALNKIRDRAGNYIEFVYFEDTANGSYMPAEIRYTGHSSVAPESSIVFVREARSSGEFVLNYFVGARIEQRYRISRIELQHNGLAVRSWDVGYKPDGSGATKLASVQECSAGDCLAPTNFEYSAATAGVTSETTTNYSTLGASVLTLDMNRDGRDDVAYFDSGLGRWVVMWGSPSGPQPPRSTDVGSIDSLAHSYARVADVDGNGYEEIAIPHSNNHWWLISFNWNSGAFVLKETNLDSGYAANSEFVDVDGDARDDLVYGVNRQVFVALSTSSWPSVTFSSSALWYTHPNFYTIVSPVNGFRYASQVYRSRIRTADANDDGRGEVLVRWRYNSCGNEPGCPPSYTYTWSSLTSTGTSFVSTSLSTNSAPPLLADFNGDGISDVATYNSSSWQLRFGTGSANASASYTPALNTGQPISGTTPAESFVLDWNGDGLSDVLVPSGGYWWYMLSTGSTLASAQNSGIPVPSNLARLRVFDFDSDGLDDYLYGNASDQFVYRRRLGEQGDLVTLVTDGFLNWTKFAYRPLGGAISCYGGADGAVVYTPGTRPFVGPVTVVCSRTASHDDGGNYTISYVYAGGRESIEGRGFLGFSRVESADSRDGMEHTSRFRQDFPYIGLLSSEVSVDGYEVTKVREIAYSYEAHTFSSGFATRYYPYASQITVKEYEFGDRNINPYSGEVLRTITSANSVDPVSGAVYDTITTVTEGSGANGLFPGYAFSSRVYHSSLFNDLDSWCLGRPSATQQTNSHSMPSGAPVIRSSSATWDGPNCRLTQSTVEPGSAKWQVTTNYYYDTTFGNPSQVTVTPAANQGQAARTTTLSWGATGRFPERITNASSEYIEIDWNRAVGRPKEILDENGLRTVLQYDGFGRLSKQTFADGTALDIVFGACTASNCSAPTFRYNVQSTMRDAAGGALRTVTQYFDAFDQLRLESSPLVSGVLSHKTWRYDNKGRVVERSFPFTDGQTVAYQRIYYDLLGRPKLIRRPVSASDSSNHDTRISYEGLTRVVTDAGNPARNWTEKFDVTGRVVRMLNPAGEAWDYEYDAFGNLTKLRDSAGSEIVNTFNERGLKMSSSDPDMGNWSYDYFPLGELKTQTDAKLQTIRFDYDALSRLTSRTLPDAAGSIVHSYEYGTSRANRDVGQPVLVQSAGPGITTYKETYAYDSQGRLAQQKYFEGATSYTFDYAYHATSGLLDQITYPTSTDSYRFRVRYEYQHGLLQQIRNGDSGLNLWRIDSTDARGLVTAATHGDPAAVNSATLHTTSAFDRVSGWLDSRQASYTPPSSPSTTITSLGFLYDRVGNLIQRQDNRQGLTENFYYDALYRLDNSNVGAATRDYTYDWRGNITLKSDVGATYSYSAAVNGCTSHAHTQPHAVRQVTGGPVTLNLCYDANGNMTSRNGVSITWFADNLPRAITRDANNSSSFEYGPRGERWRHVYRTGGNTYTTTDLGGMLEKVIGPPASTPVVHWKHYIYANGEPVAMYMRRSNGDKKTYFLANDHLGSVTTIARSDGAWTLQQSFDAFGKRRGAAWTGNPTSSDLSQMNDKTRRGFTFHEHLDSTGFIHMNGRVYDPELGRFISADPFVQAPYFSESLNRYSYVFNSPLNWTDPTGYSSSPDAPRQREDRQRPMIGGLSYAWSFLPDHPKYEREDLPFPLPIRLRPQQAMESTVDGMAAINEPDNIDNYVRLNQYWHGSVVQISHTRRGRRVSWLDISLPYESSVSRRLERWFVADVERALTTRLDSSDASHRIVVDVSLANDPAHRQLLILPCTAGDARCRQRNGRPAAGAAVRGESTMWLSPDIMNGVGGGAHELLHNIGLGHQPNSTCSIMSYCPGGTLLYDDALRIIERYGPRR